MSMVLHDWLTGNPNLEEDLRLMKHKAAALFARAADVSTEVINAELHPGKKRKREVDNWMKNAQEVKIRMDRIEEEVEQGALSNRKRLRNQIIQITKEMEELLEHAKFHNGLTVDDLASLPLVTTEMKGRQFENNLRMILSCLMTDGVSKIGVYGVGGVGKTTLAMHIHNQLLRVHHKCASVFWVTVSQKCTIAKLQHKIAKELNLSRALKEVDKLRRPTILSEALKKRSNAVLILDDMWDYFPMEKVGIPIGKNQCKLLLTTRSLDVCRRMACQKTVKVKPLSEEESWSLFAETLGNCDDLSVEARDIAKLVSKECAGLPLGITTVAASMREVFNVYEWNNTLEELTESTRIHQGMENKVFPSLQLSYSRLNDVKLQNCFLSCALYPEDFPLEREKLVNLWIMEGHLEEIQSRQRQRDVAHTMLNKLVNACLLDAPDPTGDFVKMHDLLRDMAIRISSKRHHVMIKSGVQLRQVPHLQEWTEDLTKVSLVSNKIREIPSGMTPICRNLSCLLLEDNPLTTIPDSFFLSFFGLKFLDLTETFIERAPNCISYMENLSALKFAGCDMLTYVPSLANLTELRHLDLSYCVAISVLPKGMEKLVSLECLLLRGCDKLCVAFSELTSGLSNIQCLELSCGVKDTQIKDIQKLGCLERLMGGQIHDMSNFNTYVESQHFHQLTCYQLILGSGVCGCCLDSFYNRSIIIGGATIEPAQLPHNVHELLVESCYLRSLVHFLPSLNSLTKLMRLLICQCSDMESIWSELSCATPTPTLENLQELMIFNLYSFGALAKGRVQIPPGALSNLKKLEVRFCSTVLRLFTPCLLNGQLWNLEEIEIEHCPRLEEIFSGFDWDDESDDVSGDATLLVELPKLRVLTLRSLPGLLMTGLVCCKSVEKVTVMNCPNLKKLPLVLQGLGNRVQSPPPCLHEIIVARNWWESLVWDNLQIKHTLEPFVQFS